MKNVCFEILLNGVSSVDPPIQELLKMKRAMLHHIMVVCKVLKKIELLLVVVVYKHLRLIRIRTIELFF